MLAAFCAALLLCVIFKVSVSYALAAGLVMFMLYGRSGGFSWRELWGMALSGIRAIKNILVTFILICLLTALWRAAGTIPVIVCYAARLIRPGIFLLMSFLLNCLVSVLTGTSFGTAATMGVICASIGAAMGINPVLSGGAILSGAFFGDRCSPVSTSALLVAEITHTNIFDNIHAMLRSAAVPFAACCLVYTLLGFFTKPTGQMPELQGLFSGSFRLHWIALLPAVVILVLSAARVDVKTAMGCSILAALPICVFLQNFPLKEIPELLIMGYRSADPQLAPMIDGGGICSLLGVAAIICLSSSYSGIFEKTGMLDKIQRAVVFLSGKISAYTIMFCVSFAVGMVACNQTLTIMLAHQLCGETEKDPGLCALHLEDTAVIVAPLFPWSIAVAVPLASIGAPPAAILCSFFLLFIPLWNLMSALYKRLRSKNAGRSHP